MCTTHSTSSVRWWGRIPIPSMVRDFQTVIGNETRAQMLEADRAASGPGSGAVIGGGSAMPSGMFHPFIDDQRRWRFMGVEAAGDWASNGDRAMPPAISKGTPGVLHGNAFLPAAGRATARSSKPIPSRAGLDYPGIGPEHSLAQGYRPGRNTSFASPTRKRWTLSCCCAKTGRHHSGAGTGACHRRMSTKGARAR